VVNKKHIKNSQPNTLVIVSVLNGDNTISYSPSIKRGLGGVSFYVRNFPSKFQYHILLFFLIIFFFSHSFSKEKAVSDSLLKKFPEITVTSPRESENRTLNYFAVSLLGKKEIQTINPTQISDILGFVPGLFVKNYGGLGGMKTISVYGGSAQQTSIFLDGIPLSSVQSGMIDLSVIPASLIDGMEIIRGGSSSIFGGNSVTGTVNMLTKNSDGKDRLSTKFSYGSFGESSVVLHGDKKINNWGLGGFFEFDKSTGDFPFQTEQFGNSIETRRQNGDFRNLSASVSLMNNPKKFSIFSRVLYRNSDRGTPGAVIQGHIESSDARLNEQELLMYVNNSYHINDKESFHFNIYGKYNLIDYTNSEISLILNSLSSSFFSRDAGVLCAYRYNSELAENEVSASYSFSNLNGSKLITESSGYAQRQIFSISAKSDINLFSVFETDWKSVVSARYDFISDAGNAVSPMIALLIRSKNYPFLFKTGLSFNFRPPGFNELYYLNYGNRDLKPERAISFTSGLIWEPFSNLSAGLDGFYIITRDGIVSVPKSPVTWSAQNYGKVLSKGLCLNLNSNFFNNLIELKYTYTLQFITNENESVDEFGKQIPYIPKELLSGLLMMNYEGYEFGTDVQYTGFRFTLPDNSYTSLMPSNWICNVFACKSLHTLGLDLNLRLDAMNILNENYAIILNYPMPGRSFKGTIGIKI